MTLSAGTSNIMTTSVITIQILNFEGDKITPKRSYDKQNLKL